MFGSGTGFREARQVVVDLKLPNHLAWVLIEQFRCLVDFEIIKHEEI